MKQSTVFFALVTVWAGSVVAQTTDATTTSTVTSATGTITQLNYDSNGSVQGFLVSTNILLQFPSSICGGLSTLGVVGNSVTYSGKAVTVTSGFESVQLTSFTNNTTKATYTAPTATATTYGPTSGTVKALNYSTDGTIDGFLFTASGATVFVSTGSRASTTLAPLLLVGTAVSVTGKTSTQMAACAATGTLESVDATALTIGTQTIVIAGGGNGGGPGGGGPGGPGGHK